MKVCCENGRAISEMNDFDRLSCNHDHCKGPINLEDFLLYSCGKLDPTECISAHHLSTLIPNRVTEETT